MGDIYWLNPTPFQLLIRSKMSTSAQPKSQNDSQYEPLVKRLFESRWADRVTNWDGLGLGRLRDLMERKPTT